jgi:pimeloyl-ACP methyl ester carboxylesterase
MRTSLRVCVALVAAIVIAGAAGRWYESRAEAADARRFPPPGRFIDAGGRRLHVVCIGGGSPVVLFEPPGFGNSLSFSKARETLARRLRVCSYDRAGAGWSDPAGDPLSVGTLADDALRILDAVSPGARAIVVASSVGGLTAELLARRHPERVAGVLFLDSGTSDTVRAAEGIASSIRLAALCATVPSAARLGLIRLFDPFGIEPSRSEERARSAAVTYRPGPWDTLCALVHGYAQTREAFAQAPPQRRTLPVVVLSAESRTGLGPPWLDSQIAWVQPVMRAAHQAMAARSDAGVWRIVPGSDHLIASSQPQAVVDAVYDVLPPSR